MCMKLMIAIPTLDYLHFEFTRCLAGLVKRLAADGVDFDVCFKGSTLVYQARDGLAAEAVNSGYTHVLWLDGDMLFDSDILYKLQSHEKPFVTGVYSSRHHPYESVIFETLDPPTRPKKYPDGLFEAQGCGFGCVLTETEMLAKVFRKHGFCFQPTPDFGEDLAFCIRAREEGYALWCDPTVKCGHIGHLVIWPDSNL